LGQGWEVLGGRGGYGSGFGDGEATIARQAQIERSFTKLTEQITPNASA
jgi:hypothetical protein